MPTEVAAWHSVVDLVDFNWSGPAATPDWQRLPASGSALGWRDTSPV